MRCDYCGSEFKTEKGHASHSCAKKRLSEDIGEVGLRRAYVMFDQWFRYNTFSKKPKTREQFLKSPYFKDFINLEKSLRGVHIVSPASYIRWLSDERIPARDWCKNTVIERYKSVMDKIEDATDVAVRSLEKIAMWCDEKHIDLPMFFDEIRVNEMLSLVKSGRLSPWVLFLSEKSDGILGALKQDQLEELDDAVDIEYWTARFSVSKKAVEDVRMILEKVGL